MIGFRRPVRFSLTPPDNDFDVAVRAVSGEVVSGAGAAISLLHREKNSEFFQPNRELKLQNRELSGGSGNRRTGPPQLQLGGTQPPLPNFVQLAETDVNGDSPDGSPGCQR